MLVSAPPSDFLFTALHFFPVLPLPCHAAGKSAEEKWRDMSLAKRVKVLMPRRCGQCAIDSVKSIKHHAEDVWIRRGDEEKWLTRKALFISR